MNMSRYHEIDCAREEIIFTKKRIISKTKTFAFHFSNLRVAPCDLLLFLLELAMADGIENVPLKTFHENGFSFVRSSEYFSSFDKQNQQVSVF